VWRAYRLGEPLYRGEQARQKGGGVTGRPTPLTKNREGMISVRGLRGGDYRGLAAAVISKTLKDFTNALRDSDMETALACRQWLTDETNVFGAYLEIDAEILRRRVKEIEKGGTSDSM